MSNSTVYAMSNQVGVRYFSNNVRTVLLIIVVLSCVLYGVFNSVPFVFTGVYTPLISFMVLPIGYMATTIWNYHQLKKTKEINAREGRRLDNILNEKTSSIRNVILLYLGLVLVIGFLTLLGSSIVPVNLIVSILLATCIAAIYSVYMSFVDQREMTDFEAKMRDRASAKLARTEFSGKKKSSS